MVKPVRSEKTFETRVNTQYLRQKKDVLCRKWKDQPLRKRETSSSWGMLSSRHSQYLDSSGRFFKYSRQAWVGYNLLSSLYTTPQVFTSSSVNSIRGTGSPLEQGWKKIFKDQVKRDFQKGHLNMQKRTVYRPWQDQQSTFAFSGRHCPWNPDEKKQANMSMIHTKDFFFF